MHFVLSRTLLLLTLLFLISCQKEADGDVSNPSNPSSNPTASGNFKAKINGAQWTANKMSGGSRLIGLISVFGVATDKKMIAITLTDSGVHRYTLNDKSINVAAVVDSSEANPIAYTTNQSNDANLAGGEVNITSIDASKKTMSGTFSFKAYRLMDNKKFTITEGSFTNVPYATTLPPSATTDTLTAKIDGTLWKPESVSSVSSNGTLAVSASNSTATKSIGLMFPSNITPGAYTLDFWGATYIAQYNPDNDPVHSKTSVSGTLTILEHNTSTRRIRGSFAFRGEEVLTSSNFANISEGYFSVKY